MANQSIPVSPAELGQMCIKTVVGTGETKRGKKDGKDEEVE